MEKRDKYDTNPLDPEYAHRVRETSGKAKSHDRGNGDSRSVIDKEAPTRVFEDPMSGPYPSINVPPRYQQPQNAPNVYRPAATLQPLTSRKIPGINLPENVVLVVPYLPFYIGAVFGAVELFLLPRTEARARFHAAQGLALHLVVLAFHFLLKFIGAVTGSNIGVFILSLAAMIFFIVSVIRVWKGEPHHIEPLDDVTSWLNEKIDPRK